MVPDDGCGSGEFGRVAGPFQGSRWRGVDMGPGIVASSPPEQPGEHALHRMPMVRGSGAHATDRAVLAPLFFEVRSTEQPTADAALASVRREERSSTHRACERQAHHSIVA